MTSTYDPTQNVFKQIFERLESIPASGGGDGISSTGGDTPETLAFYEDAISELQSILTAIAAGADTTAAAEYYITATSRLTAIKSAVEAVIPATTTAAFYSANIERLQLIINALAAGADTVAAANYYAAATTSLAAIKTAAEALVITGPTVSTQTLNAPGVSASVSGVGKISPGVQLLWTGASTPQYVALEGSRNGTSWVRLSEDLTGDVFTTDEITYAASTGVQLEVGYQMLRPEYTSYRLRWISGTATSLALTWGIV